MRNSLIFNVIILCSVIGTAAVAVAQVQSDDASTTASSPSLPASVQMANLDQGVMGSGGRRRIMLSLPGIAKSQAPTPQAEAAEATEVVADATPIGKGTSHKQRARAGAKNSAKGDSAKKDSKASRQKATEDAAKTKADENVEAVQQNAAPDAAAPTAGTEQSTTPDTRTDPLAPPLLRGVESADLLPNTPQPPGADAGVRLQKAGVSNMRDDGAMPPDLSELYNALAKKDGNNVSVRTLALLVQQVLARNPDLMQAEALSRQADERVKEARWGRFPTANISSSVGHDNMKYGATNKGSSMTSSMTQIKVTAPLLDLSLNSLIDQRKSASMESDWQLTEVREQLMMRTVEMFAELVRSNRLVELARGNLKSHREYVAQMKSIARSDMGRAADLPAAQARVALAETVLVSRLSRLDNARVQWTQLTSLPAPDVGSKSKDSAETGVVLSELPLVSLPATVDVAVANAVENSAQLQKALAEIETAKAAVNGTRTGFLPKVNAEIIGKRGNNYGGTAGTQRSWYVGLGFDWTMPTNPSRSHAVNAAQEGLVAVMYARERMMQQIKAKVEEQWYALLASDNSFRSFQSYVSSSEKVVQTYQQQFRIGRRSLLDVLNAENELFNARSNYETARADLTQSAWKLLAMQGKLRQELGI